MKKKLLIIIIVFFSLVCFICFFLHNNNINQTTGKKRCKAPRNVVIDSNGKVSWTNSKTSDSYEISINKNKGYVKFKNGNNYLKTITSKTGKRKVYVRSVCDSSVYDETSPAKEVSVDVYSVNLKAGDGIKSVVGSGNYIKGSTIKCDASVLDKYIWSKWIKEDKSTYSTDKSLKVVVKDNLKLTAVAKPDGYLCPENYYLPANSTKCEPCPEGSWCAGGIYKKDEDSQGVYDRETLCDMLNDEGVQSFDYETFTSKFDTGDNADNYYSIKAVHDCANKYGKPVVVSENKTYNIYMKSDTDKALDPIKVMTSTDFNNSTIYIHDENGIIKGSSMLGNVYEIVNDSSRERIYAKAFINNIGYNQVIREFSGRGNALVTIKNGNRKVFKRSGSNADSDGGGNSAYDVFRVDNDGRILDPLFWAYDSIDTSDAIVRKNIEIFIYPISDVKLVFKNAKFYNIIDGSDYSNDDIYANYGGYAMRGILLKRSNSVIENIQHGYVNENHDLVANSTYGYNGFFSVGTSANITLNNLRVQPLKVNSAHSSSYDLYLNGVAGIDIKNVRMNGFDGENQLSSKDYWGVTGTNWSKNVVYDNCSLNRIDTHRGVYNLTVRDSEVGVYGLNQIGFGEMNITRVTVKHTNQFIRLRDDYGSLWNGTVNVQDCGIIPDNNDPVYLVSAKVIYDNDGFVHDYGYDLRIPNVNLNGFKVYNSSNDFYVFNIGESPNKANGNLEYIKNNYIRPNSFNFYYPSNDAIHVNNVRKCSNGDSGCSSINTHNYVKEFNQSSVSQVQSQIGLSLNKMLHFILDLFR